MKTLQIPFKIAIVSFLLNIIWENSHAPLFYGFSNYINHFKMCFDATIGDVFLILTMYFLISFLLKNFKWIESLKKKETFYIIIIGFIIAFIFEKYAIETGRWKYNQNMPIIPLLGVGLSPVLQMIITPYLTFWFVGKFGKENKKLLVKN